MIMEIAAISFLCLALGLVIGYEWGERRGKNNSECGMRNAELNNDLPMFRTDGEPRTVVECGREWTVYGGRQ